MTEQADLSLKDQLTKTDFYEILGLTPPDLSKINLTVPGSAEYDNVNTIDLVSLKKSYLRLASIYHPDKYTSSTTDQGQEQEKATSIFQSINAAWTCLKDDNSRKMYNLVGRNRSLYEQLMAQQEQAKSMKPSFRKTVPITLRDYFSQDPFVYEHVVSQVCINCNGTTFVDCIDRRCRECSVGTSSTSAPFTQGVDKGMNGSMPCFACNNTGIDPSEGCPTEGDEDEADPRRCTRCSECENGHITTTDRHATNLRENSASAFFSTEEYDLHLQFVFSLTDTPDYHIDRVGSASAPFSQGFDRLVKKMAVSLASALTGFSESFVHPNGKLYTIVSSKGYVVQPNTLYVLPHSESGIGSQEESGYLHLLFDISFPKSLSLPIKRAFNWSNLRSFLSGESGPTQASSSNSFQSNIFLLDTLETINLIQESEQVQTQPEFVEFDPSTFFNTNSGGAPEPNVHSCHVQ